MVVFINETDAIHVSGSIKRQRRSESNNCMEVELSSCMRRPFELMLLDRQHLIGCRLYKVRSATMHRPDTDESKGLRASCSMIGLMHLEKSV